MRKLMKNISLLQQGFTICKMLLSVHHHLKDGHFQTASINEILQQKHIIFLAISKPYYNIINIEEPSLQRCTLFNHYHHVTSKGLAPFTYTIKL